MTSLRAFFRAHRQLAILLVAVSLALKALVPAGYMIGSQAKILTVEICADASGGTLTRQIVIPQDGKSAGGHAESGKSDSTCAFSALAMVSLSGADSAVLAIALLFILALGFAPAPTLLISRARQLRPPLRGPPALI